MILTSDKGEFMPKTLSETKKETLIITKDYNAQWSLKSYELYEPNKTETS